MKPSSTDSRPSLFTRDFCLLFAANFIVVCIYFLLITTMAYYAVSSFGVGDSVAGLTASIFLVGGVVGRIVSARYAMHFGLRRIALVSLVVQLAMTLLYFASGLGIGFLVAVRFVHGFSFGIANTVVPAMAVEIFPENRIGEGTGYFMMSNSLGVGIGPLMSVFVALGMDYSILFVLCAVLSVGALASVLLVKPKDGATIVEERPRPKGHSGREPWTLRSIIDFSTVRLSVFMFLVAFSYSSLNSFTNSYANELGMAIFAPFVFLVYSVTLVITRPITGKLMDRFGENAVLYPSIASMAVGLALAACVQNPVMLLLCGVFMATGFGTCMSTGQAAVVKQTKENTALAISTFFLLCDAGCGIGPFLLGFIVTGAGYSAMYWQCAVVALVALVYYHFAHGRQARRSMEAETAACTPGGSESEGR